VFRLRNCVLCALIFEKKIKFFIKFTFLKIFKFLLPKKMGCAAYSRAQGIQENMVFLVAGSYEKKINLQVP
jgi:hypothetical protein